MRSIKFYSLGLLIASLGMLFIAITFSEKVVKPVFHDTYEFREEALSYDVTLGELKLPIAVLGNIADQYENDEVYDQVKNDRLNEAYNANLIKLRSQIQVVIDQLNTMNSIIETAGNYPLVKHYKEYYEVSNQVKAIKMRVESALSRTNQLSFDNVGNEKTSIDSMSSDLNLASLLTKTLLKNMAVWSKELIDAYMRFVNGIYLLLILTSIVLGGFLYRLLKTNMQFFEECFKRLSRFEKLDNLVTYQPVFIEEQRLYRTINDIFKEQGFLNEIKETSNQYFILDEFLDQLFWRVQDIMPTDRLGIAFLSENKQKIVAEYGICNYDTIHLKSGYEMDLEKTTLKEVIEHKKSYYDNDLLAAFSKNQNSKSLRLILNEGIRSNMVVPLMNNSEVFGVLFFSSRKTDAFNEVFLQIGKNISHELSSVIHKTYLTKKMLSMVTETFARLVEERDVDTGDHISRMTRYATLLAEKLVDHPIETYRVDNAFIREISNHAPAHDIGKIGIPDYILKKNGKLTAEEFEIMKNHSRIGGDILISMQEKLKSFGTDFFKNASDIVLYHHEKWDGTGYPLGLKGEEIPLSARIVAIADVFDALISKRVYKEPYPYEKSVEILKESSGHHLDPILTEIFIGIVQEFHNK